MMILISGADPVQVKPNPSQTYIVRVTTARWSPITRYLVFYPDLLAIGGGTHDMCTVHV